MKFRVQSMVVIVGACLLWGVEASHGQVGTTGQSAMQKSGEEKAPSREALFAWFDGLGYPDVKGKAFVRLVVTYRGGTGVDPDEKAEPTYKYGWVMREKKGEWVEIFEVDLASQVYPLKPSDAETTDLWDCKLEPASVEGYAREWLKAVRKLKEEAEGTWQFEVAYTGYGTRPLSARGQAFVLARVLSAQGEPQKEALSREIFEESKQTPDYQDSEKKSYREHLSGDLGYAEFWHAVSSIKNEDVSREELLARFERLVKNYPKAKEVKEAEEYAGKIKAIIEADRNRVVKDWGKMSTDERARELVHRLRIQNRVPGEIQASSHVELIKMGLEAVPALIDAFDDPALTRSMMEEESTQWVGTVGESAGGILFSIARREFFPHPGPDGTMMTAKEDARAWWAQVQAKGMKQMAIEEVEKKGANAREQLYYLIEHHPDDAMPVIKKAYESAKNREARADLVSASWRLKDEASRQWQMELMAHGEDLQARMNAAFALKKNGQPGPVDAVLLEWEKIKDKEPEEVPGYNSVVSFLRASGDLRALAALAEWLKRQPVKVRTNFLLNLEAYPLGWPGVEEIAAPKNAYALAVEAMLVGELGDKERHEGLGLVEIDSPRVCDVAGIRLARAWPERYRFKPRGSLWERDRALAVMRNQWLKAHGKAELALPEEPKAAWLGQAELEPLIGGVMDAKDDAAREKGVEALVGKGPAGFKAVMEAGARLAQEDMRRAVLEGAAKQMANVVARVTVEEKPTMSGGTLPEMLKGWEGKPLTGKAWAEMMARTAKDLPAEVCEICVEAVRSKPGLGFEVKVEIVRGKLKENEKWQGSLVVEAKGVSLHASADKDALNEPDTHGNYDLVAKRVGRGLNADVEHQAIIRWRLERIRKAE